MQVDVPTVDGPTAVEGAEFYACSLCPAYFSLPLLLVVIVDESWWIPRETNSPIKMHTASSTQFVKKS